MSYEHTSDLYGQVPETWFAKSSMTFIEGQGMANVIMSSEPVGNDVDSATYARSQGELLESEFNEYEELSFGPDTVFGDKAGFVREFQWIPLDGVPIRQIQVYHAAVGRGFVATATVPVTNFPAIGSTLRGILAELRCTPPPGRRWVLSESPDETRRRVQAGLTSMPSSIVVDAAGRFSLYRGSTKVWVEVKPWLDPGGLVTVFALTNRAVPKSQELFEFLATHVEELTFGRLGVWPEAEDAVTVVFRYSLLGSTLDDLELMSAVEAVAETADRLDDIVKERFGGRHFEDHISGAAPALDGGDHPEDELPVGFYI